MVKNFVGIFSGILRWDRNKKYGPVKQDCLLQDNIGASYNVTYWLYERYLWNAKLWGDNNAMSRLLQELD